MSSRGEIFSINFIRQQHLPLPIRRLLVSLTFLYLVLGVAAVGFFIFKNVHVNKQASSELEALKSQLPVDSSLDSLQKDWETLSSRAANELGSLRSATAVQKEKFKTAEKLAAIARTLPGGTWVTQLRGSRSALTLNLNAVYAAESEHFKAPAKDWVEALKKDPNFGAGLSSLELVSSSQKKQGKLDLYTFDLSAQWSRS